MGRLEDKKCIGCTGVHSEREMQYGLCNECLELALDNQQEFIKRVGEIGLGPNKVAIVLRRIVTWLQQPPTLTGQWLKQGEGGVATAALEEVIDALGKAADFESNPRADMTLLEKVINHKNTRRPTGGRLQPSWRKGGG